MTVNEIVNVYLKFRAKQSVAEAAAATIDECSITPSVLVDTFGAAQLNLSFSDKEAEALRKHRNELLSHFNGRE